MHRRDSHDTWRRDTDDFSTREGAEEEFNRKYEFLQKVEPEELGIVTDMQIAVYDGG